MKLPCLILCASGLCAAVLTASPASAAPKEGRGVLIDVQHGDFPEIDSLSYEGEFPASGVRFALTLRYEGDGWTLRLERAGWPPVRLRLPRRFRPLVASRTQIWAGTRDVVYVRLGFGQPLDKCFVNGAEVYAGLHLAFGPEGLSGAEELRFSSCEPQWVSLPASGSDGVHELSEPPA